MAKICDEHSGLAGCASNLKKEIDDKIWPAIRKISDKSVSWRTFYLFGVIVIAFGLLLIGNNTMSSAQNEKDIRCLQVDINKKLERIEKAVTQ